MIKTDRVPLAFRSCKVCRYIRQDGGYIMKNTVKILIATIAVVAALTAAVTAFLVYKDKKERDEAELEHYLDCSIQ